MKQVARRGRARRRREDARGAILAAAEELLAEGPLRDLDVETLMRRAGRTRTAFYRHFADPMNLVQALVEDRARELVALGERWAVAPEAGPRVAREHLAEVIAFYREHAVVFRVLDEAARHDDGLERLQRGVLQRATALMADGIAGRVARGQIPPADAFELARALTLMIHSYLLDALSSSPAPDPDRMLDVLWRVWVGALRLEEDAA